MIFKNCLGLCLIGKNTFTRSPQLGLPSISSTLNAGIFCTNNVLAVFSSYMYIAKAAKTTFVRKICMFNVDEIDTWCEFRHASACARVLTRATILGTLCSSSVLFYWIPNAAVVEIYKLTYCDWTSILLQFD